MSDNGTVLLVEDNPADAELAQIAFTELRSSFQVTHVRDGVEALAFLESMTWRKPGVPTLLMLLDLKLPRVDGVEVLKKVRQNSKFDSVRIGVLTSSGEERERVLGLGADFFIQKAVDFDTFVGRLGDVLHSVFDSKLS